MLLQLEWEDGMVVRAGRYCGSGSTKMMVAEDTPAWCSRIEIRSECRPEPYLDSRVNHGDSDVGVYSEKVHKLRSKENDSDDASDLNERKPPSKDVKTKEEAKKQCYVSYDQPIFTSPLKLVPVVISSDHPDSQYEWKDFERRDYSHPNSPVLFLTDNGSNVLAAFKPHQVDESQNQDDGSEWPEVDLEEIEAEEIEDRLDKDELNGDELLQKEADFEECEDRHKAAFVGFWRTSCFSHTLACGEGI
uniref:Uncharacterized protein n=1 Tax=Amphimedon queenslandica TaxID=400682 RepID=A0A1X7U6V6_AMPQE